ncbi:MAG: hypothetical protein LBC64_08585 [Fibromonadaceae bacterium]|nr:hypothetical protein [Fibromonadaceae bacterium]
MKAKLKQMQILVTKLWTNQSENAQALIMLFFMFFVLCVIAYNGTWDVSKDQSPKSQLGGYMFRGLKDGLVYLINLIR